MLEKNLEEAYNEYLDTATEAAILETLCRAFVAVLAPQIVKVIVR